MIRIINALPAFRLNYILFSHSPRMYIAAPIVQLKSTNVQPMSMETNNSTKYELTLIEPSPLDIQCRASGTPTPIVSWTLNGHTLMSTARIHHRLLTIHQPQLSSAPFSSGEVVVINEQEGYVWNAANVSTTPQVNQSSPMVPHRQRGRVQLFRSDDGSVLVSLTISMDASEKKVSGKYICSALNAVGSDEAGLLLNVLGKRHSNGVGCFIFVYCLFIVPPAFPSSSKLKTPEDNRMTIEYVTTLAGQPAILSCRATGRPEPHFYWFHGDRNISAQTADENIGRFLIMNGGKTLTLLEPSARDAGEYSCLAKNAAGEQSIRYNVTVFGKISHI